MKITVLGDGGWGTALSILLYNKGYDVWLWSKFPEYARILQDRRENVKFLPGIKLPDKIEISTDIKEAVKRAELLIFAVPSRYFRSICEMVKHTEESNSVEVYLSVAKGIEQGTLKRMSEVVKEVLGNVSVAALSGPSHAEEVARELPAAVVVASEDIEVAKKVQLTFISEKFRVYTSEDILGVELGGALKNVIAIAVGICDGLNLGDNAKSALMCRGMAEISRLGLKMGARRETFSGLAGIGDIIVTCMSRYGRNLAFGKKIGQGVSVEEAINATPMVIEGYYTTASAYTLAQKYKVDMPITEKVYEVLYKGKDYRNAVIELMKREPKPEWT